ncbi:MAG TPA: hypothetical protein QGF58_08275 [Myxococcota bacterium]|nr:hypothetical protein [Myxococcota bacterium]
MWLISVALAQNSSDEWRTVETDHYRLHYPLQAEAWALQTASQMDDIRARTSEEIGYAPPQIIDVVVMDPYVQSNGWALPSLRRPRMGLYASPPPAHSGLGHYRSWSEDLVVHEDAHQVHLLIPSRHPVFDGLAYWTIGYGPLSRKSPRWVAEGYATVIEGRLTGWGRPNSRGRQVFLATLARYGVFPTYDELDFSNRWQGRGYAYLIGSAYLEWLEATYGQDSVRQLWVAMSAKDSRDFDEAFEAVYGEDPATLYQHFTAWVTFGAVWPEVWGEPLEDSVWLELEGTTSAPTLSRDGKRIAFVDESGLAPRLTVMSLAEDEEAREEWEEADAGRLEEDPDDILLEPPRHFHAEVEYRRARPDRAANFPRWVGDDLLFTSWWLDEGGNYVPDLFLWTPGRGERRVTTDAAVIYADPHPNLRSAVGVRTRWGSSQLVEVDLKTGAVTELTEPRADVVHDAPRFDPDGESIVYLLDDATGGWRLIHRDLDSGEERELELPLGVTPTSPEWAPDGQSVYVSIGDEIWSVPLDGGATEVVVKRVTGAFAPAAERDGSGLFFLSMHPDGLDLHRVALEGRERSPVLIDAMDEPPPPPEKEAVTPGRYAPGLPYLAPLAGAAFDHTSWSADLGFHVSDRAGRAELIGWVTADGDGLPGGSLFMANHWFPVRLGAGVAFDGLKDDRHALLLLSVARDERWDGGVGWAEVGAWTRDQGDAVGFIRGGAGHEQWFGPGFARGGLDLHAQGGQEAGGLWDLRASLGGGVWGVGLVGSAGVGSSGGSPFQVGGTNRSSLLGGTASQLLFVPGLPKGSLVASRHQVTRVELVTPVAVSLFGERHVDLDDGDAVSFVGVGVREESPPIPMDMRPSLDLDTGIGCQLEYASGPSPTPCGRLEDYRFWLSATWKPRIE